MGSVVSLGNPLVSNILRFCWLLSHIDASEFQLLLRLLSVPEPNERTSGFAVKTNILRNLKAVFSLSDIPHGFVSRPFSLANLIIRE